VYFSRRRCVRSSLTAAAKAPNATVVSSNAPIRLRADAVIVANSVMESTSRQCHFRSRKFFVAIRDAMNVGAHASTKAARIIASRARALSALVQRLSFN
jgi:hypothetical protein